uniref:Uncharacterized protein n=1 Tax=Rhizophora mucronata TaxID=61149 RepID=A0A2P2QR07_RHIMU
MHYQHFFLLLRFAGSLMEHSDRKHGTYVDQ